MLEEIYVVHYKSESCDDYYTAFARKPNEKRLESWMREEIPDSLDYLDGSDEYGPYSIWDLGSLTVQKVDIR